MSTGAASSTSNSIAGAYVTEDIWFEIFLRLPLDSIFKFRCVCKVWISILSNPRFIKSWYKLNNSLLPWGFIYYIPLEIVGRPFAVSYPESYSHSHIVSLHQNGFTLSFLNPIIPNRCLCILGSSNGLVLCGTSLYAQRSYYVCNPLTKKWVSLPPPPSPDRVPRVAVAPGFICSNECDSVCYKVIRIPYYEAAATELKVEIFSSDSGEWNMYDVSVPQCFTWCYTFLDNFVTHNGFSYWMRTESSNILAFSDDRNNNHGTCGNECRLINLPDQEMDDGRECKNQYLGESEGLICYARIKDMERSLSIWVLEEDWYLVHRDTKFHDTLEEMVSRLIGKATTVELINEIQVLGFSPVNKYVVIIGYKKYIWAYNTRTKELEQLRHPSFINSNITVPHYGALAFGYKPRPTVLPPVSRRDTSILGV